MRAFIGWLIAVAIIVLIVVGELRRQRRLKRLQPTRSPWPLRPPRRSLLKRCLSRIRRSNRRALTARSPQNAHTGLAAGTLTSAQPADDDDDFHYHRQYFED